MYTGETMSSSAHLPIETLLQHKTWMQGLARRLVQDEVAADDVMQETWLASLRTPPRRLESVRGWLSKVVRSKAADSRRGKRAIVDSELLAGRASGAPSVDEAVADAELHRRVSELVLGLEPLYRDVLVLRFFEGLPPRDVAQRLACPVETVRTRTRRALDRLRAELDAGHGGDRRAWIAGLVPLARLDRGTTATAGSAAAITGVAAMSVNSKLAIGAAVALVLGLGSGWAARSASVEDGRVAELAITSALEERDAQQVRAEALAADASDRDRQMSVLTSELSEARQRAEESEAEVARLGTALEQALASAEPTNDATAVSFAAYDEVLGDIDWDSVGKNTGELVKILVTLRRAIDEGEQLSPETITGLQNKNAPLIAAAARIAGHLPGVGTNGGYASPPFMSNLMASTLEAGHAALAPDQLRALRQLANEQIAHDQERMAGYDASTLELRKLYDEVVSRTRFFEQASALLDTKQNEILRPAALRDVANLDLFSSAIQWSQAVRPIHHDGTRESVAAAIGADLRRQIRPSDEHTDELATYVREWADALPDELLESKRDALANLMMYDGAQVSRSAEHALELYERILRGVPLDPETQARLRAIAAPPVLLKR